DADDLIFLRLDQHGDENRFLEHPLVIVFLFVFLFLTFFASPVRVILYCDELSTLKDLPARIEVTSGMEPEVEERVTAQGFVAFVLFAAQPPLLRIGLFLF